MNKNDKETGVTRHKFLSSKFPVFPYSDIKRGPSTKFNESMHLMNQNTGILLNFYWNDDNTVSVGKTDTKEKSPFKSHSVVLQRSKKFNDKVIADLCASFLN